MFTDSDSDIRYIRFSDMSSTTTVNIRQTKKETMAFIQNAANLVNAGAYLRCLDPEKSFRYYKAALDVLHSATNDDAFDSSEMHSPVHLSQHPNQQEQEPAVIPYDTGSNPEPFLTLEDGSYFIYCRPFLFNQPCLNVGYTLLYIAVVIFDMALMLHKSGIYCEKNLKKSLRLYDMSLNLLRNAPSELNGCNNLI